MLRRRVGTLLAVVLLLSTLAMSGAAPAYAGAKSTTFESTKRAGVTATFTLRPPPTLQPPPTPTRTTRSTAGYRLARVVVLLGLAAACALAALGAITTPGRTDDLGATVKVVRYAEPTATGRTATRWNPATDATITVRVPEASSPAVSGG